MKTCEAIQEKLVGGDPLTPEELDHLTACDDCRSFRKTARAIARSARTVRDREDVPAREIRRVQAFVSHRTRPVRAAVRLAWASAAILVGVLGTVLVLSGVFGPEGSDTRAEESFLTLLDEVSDITRPQTEEITLDVSDTTLFSVNLLFEEEITTESTELELPGAYGILEDELQDG